MKVLTRTIPFVHDAARLLDIFQDEPQLFFLDSSLSDDPQGRYSYLGFAPIKTIKVKTFDQLRKALKPYLGRASIHSFPCGAVGTMSYEGELVFGIYPAVVGIDHKSKRLTITSASLKGSDPLSLKRAQAKMDYILAHIKDSVPPTRSIRRFPGKLAIKSNTTPAQYKQSIRQALQHITQGDIYQINLSHRLQTSIKKYANLDVAFDLYRQLRVLSPSAFSAYLDQGTRVILSSSPERFLKLSGAHVQVKPMKGTRPRSANPKQDAKNRQELLESPKEQAELLMVTDLERNDLGRVCVYGSVKVKAMRTIEDYKTVFQATSTVEGVLHKDKDQFDLLQSTFPSGSVTGCPKIEAMKIIKKLEKAPRGLYTGALGYISFTGDMDFNVLIRTMLMEKNTISFSVGGGIVADSNPQKEYEETMVKAGAMVEALKRVFR